MFHSRVYAKKIIGNALPNRFAHHLSSSNTIILASVLTKANVVAEYFEINETGVLIWPPRSSDRLKTLLKICGVPSPEQFSEMANNTK